MKLEISEKLQNDIFSSIPENYNKLEKALFIYNQLCLKLTYSIDAYVDEENHRNYFLDPTNLKYVDGEKNTDVVCYTFNYIYLQLLINAGICNENIWEKNMPFNPEMPTMLKHAHRKLELTINGIDYKVDSTFGVLDNNDLTLGKYSTHKFNGWSTATERDSKTERVSNTNIVNLDDAIKKVRKDCLELQENANRYYEIKSSEGNFYSIPLKERIEMFLQTIKDIPNYSLLSFNYLLKLKHKFFSNLELNSEELNNNISLLFVKNQKTKEYQAILFVNPNSRFEPLNYDNVETYYIDVKNKQYANISVKDLKILIKNGEITSRHNERISKYTVPMIKLDEEMQN